MNHFLDFTNFDQTLTAGGDVTFGHLYLALAIVAFAFIGFAICQFKDNKNLHNDNA